MAAELPPKSSAKEALDKTLAARRRQSLELLRLALPKLLTSKEANLPLKQVDVRLPATLEADVQPGWIIDTQMESSKRFSVVLLREALLTAGILEVRHDAARPSTVEAAVAPVSIDVQLERYEKDDVPKFSQGASSPAVAAIGHALCWPDTLRASLVLIDRELFDETVYHNPFSNH